MYQLKRRALDITNHDGSPVYDMKMQFNRWRNLVSFINYGVNNRTRFFQCKSFLIDIFKDDKKIGTVEELLAICQYDAYTNRYTSLSNIPLNQFLSSAKGSGNNDYRKLGTEQEEIC